MKKVWAFFEVLLLMAIAPAILIFIWIAGRDS